MTLYFLAFLLADSKFYGSGDLGARCCDVQVGELPKHCHSHTPLTSQLRIDFDTPSKADCGISN